MKFGKTLRDRIEPEYAAYYANYKEMKLYISLLRRGGAHGETEEGFAALVLSELEKVNEFARVILGKALQLIIQLEENIPSGATLERMSNQVSKEITVFDAFTDLNSNAIRKAVKKYQKKTGQSALWFDVIHGEQFIFLSRRIVHPLLVHFSRVYWACKEAGVTKAPWNPPASFERSTNKFWVHPHKVAEVKAMLLRHLPILELHAPTPPPTLDFFENLDDYSMTPGAITSLYLDCPSNNLPLYHDRVSLKEGANLLRIRWYGRPQLDHAILQGAPRDQQPPPKYKDYECAFVELKTHHEAWTGDKSVKRRFKIRNSELPGFFEARKSAKIELDEAEIKQLPSLRHGGESKSDGSSAKAGGLAAPPVDEKAAKTRKALVEKLALAQEVQRLVSGKRIRPLLVTEVHRTAFQSSSSNEVRVTLDAPLVGFAMPPPEALGQRGSGNSAPLANQQFWDAFLSRGLAQPQGAQDYHKPFPFAVLELKLQGDPPAWVTGLVKAWTDCGYIRCIEKYSKYQHIVNHAIARSPNAADAGASLPSYAAATMEGAPEQGKVSASWKRIEVDDKPRSRGVADSSGWYKVKIRKVPVWFTALETHGPFPGPPPARNADGYLTEDLDWSSTLGGDGGGNSPRSVYGGSTFNAAGGGFAGSGGIGKPGHSRRPSRGSGIPPSLHRRGDSNLSVKSGVGLTRTGGGAAGGSKKGGKFSARQLSLRSFQQTVKNHANTINKASNVRVEPKTFFANERTFIQWISAAVFVYGVSTALFAFDASESDNSGVAIASAAILSAVALSILIYGAVIFYLRLNRLKNKKDSRVFADKWGPGMLSLGLFAAIVTVLVMQFVEYISANDAPTLGVAGVADAVTHAQSFLYDGVVFAPTNVTRTAALTKLASELNAFVPNKAYDFSNLSNGRPTKRLRRRREYIIATGSVSDIATVPLGEAVLVSAQEELYMYPDTFTGSYDVVMEFFNTASIEFVGPYPTTAYASSGDTKVRLSVRCSTADGDAFSGTNGWRTAVEGVNGTMPTPSSETALGTYFQNVDTALGDYLGTSNYVFTDAGTTFVWSTEFDLDLDGLNGKLVWEIEYGSEEAASNAGDVVFNTSLPSILSLEVTTAAKNNFTTEGLAAAEAFYMQVAGGGLSFVDGRECN